MAKPADITPEQEAALRKRLHLQEGGDLELYYGILSEADIRRLAGMGTISPPSQAPTSAPSAPSPVKPVVGTPIVSTPTITPPASTPAPKPVVRTSTVSIPPIPKLAIGTPINLPSLTQVQPESGMPMRVTNPAAGTSSQEKIDAALEARRRAVTAASSKTTAGMALSPEAAGEAIQRGERLAVEPRTVSGETRVPIGRTMLGDTAEKYLEGIPIIGDIAVGLAPQVIETAEQKKQRDDDAYQATRAFFQNNPQWEMTPINVKKVYGSFRYHGGMAPYTLDDMVAHAAMTYTAPTGTVVESPLTTALKTINIGETALVTVPQYVGGKAGAYAGGDISVAPPFRETFRSNIASGANLMTAGEEAGAVIGKEAGLSPENQDLVRNLGGGAGFISSLLIPIDLGVGSVASGALKAGSSALKIGKAFEESVPRIALSTVEGGIKGSIQGGFDAYRIMGNTGVQDVISNQLAEATQRWMKNPKVNRIVDTTLSLAGEDAVQSAIKVNREAGEAAAKTSQVFDDSGYMAQLEAAFNDLKARSAPSDPINEYNTFTDYLKEAESFGIDITNSAGKRAFILGQPPENVVAKEARDALKKTSTGARTVDYFDELSAGGRSSLYYDAFLNTLNDAQKEKLLAGGSLRSSEFYGALDKYVNDLKTGMAAAGQTENQINNALQGFERQLLDKGIKIPEGRIIGKGAGSEAYKYGGLIVTPEIKGALKDSYKVDLARRLKNSLAEKTGITGTSVRIGNIVLSKADATAAVAEAKKKANLETIMGKIKKSGGIADLSDKEMEGLREYFINPFGTSRPLSTEIASSTQFIRPTEFYSPFNVINDIVRIERTGKINAQQYNNLIQAAVALEASSKTSAKTIEKVSQISSTLSSEGSEAALSYFLKNVMSPKDLQQTGIIGSLVDISKKVIPPKTQSIVANEIIMDVNAQLASLPERFKSAMRKNITKTGSNPKAFAATIIEEFTQGFVFKPLALSEIGTPIQVESAGVRKGFPTESIEAANKVNVGSYEMFRTYIASIYGGYEQTIDAIATTGRTLNIDDMAISTKEMRDLISVVIEVPFLKQRLVTFQDAILKGKNIEALNILQRTHIDLYGYSLQQVLTRKAGISETEIAQVLRGYTETASQQISNDALSFFSSKKPGASRGIDEAYKAASHQAPIIKPSNFKEMLVGSYYSKSQANIIDEALFKAQSKYPELFPSDATLKQIAEADWNTTRNALVYNILNPSIAATPSEVSLANNIVKILEEEIEGSRLLITEEGSKTLSQLRSNLMVAAIEDNVSAMTGGAGMTKRYLNTLMDSALFSGLSTEEIKTARKIIAKALDDMETKPGSVYNQLFNTSARSDATVLFYQTALTNIRNQLKVPFSGSLQGVAEKIQTIPLLVAEQASLKKPLFGAANLRSITDTISGMKLAAGEVKLDQIIAKNGEKIAADITKAEEAVNSIALQELSPEVIALAKKKEQVLADIKTAGEFSYRRWMTDALLSVLPENGVTSAMSGLAKGGMLGGNLLPNIVYMMGNHLTGPTIIATTLGLGSSATAMKSLLFLDRDVNEVMKAIYAPYWAKTDRVLFTAQDGTIWTRSMLSDIVENGSIGRSQAQAELSNQLIASSIDWAGRTGLFGDKNAAVKWIRRNFISYYDMNIFTALANGTDQMYRTSMLIRGLKNGESVEAAKTLAREALFDYGNLTQFEKDAVSKIFWFWTFRRNSWKAIFTSAATDSRGLKAAFNMGNGLSYAWDIGKKVLGMDENDLDMRYATKDYSESRMFLDLIEDPEFKRRYALYGPPIPAKQAVADMIDYISIPFTLAAYKRGLVDTEKGFIGSGVDLVKLVASQSNPAIQAVATIGFGLDIRTGSETSSYLDPKLMWYLQQNPETFYTFTSIVGVEPVPYEQEKPGVGYYDGRQWRLKKDDYSKRAWAAMRTQLLVAGMQRTAQDYAPIFNMVGVPTNLPEGKVEQPIQIDAGNAWINMLRSAGVIVPQDAPMIQEIQKRNREAAAREIQGLPLTSSGAPQPQE